MTNLARWGEGLGNFGGSVLRGVWAVLLCGAAACGGNTGAGGPDATASDSPGPDVSVPDAGVPDGRVPDAMQPDGGVDPGPFPRDPHAGQYEWAVIIPGLGDQVVLANGQDGTFFVAGTHRRAIDLGDVHVPAPVGNAIAILKLDARARPIWARSLGGGTGLSWQNTVRSATVTADGDVLIGGAFLGNGFDAGTGPLPAVGETEGFVALLDGRSGATRWARSFAGGGDDDVSTVAAGPSSDALYVHGEIADQRVNGVWQPGFAFLERYDANGQRLWSRHLNMQVSWQHELAVDRVRGPVISGRYFGSLEVDGLRLEVELGDQGSNLAVIGFTPDGQARFARQIFDENRGYFQRLLAAPDGRLYLSTTTEANELVLDDEHGIEGPNFSSDAVLLRLTPDGAYDWGTLIDAQVAAYPHLLAADGDGAVYMVGRCDRGIALSPPIVCGSGGSFLVSYGPNGEYRWSTYVYGSPGWAQAIAAVPGRNRLLVAGEVGPSADFGGVRVQGAGLFVASLVTGPTYADPLPPPPVVTSVVLDGIADGQIRQGGSGTIVVSGDHLEQIRSVRVGSRDLFLADATPGTLRIPYSVPHGEALGPLRLVLTHPRGQLSVTSGVEVSPIVVAPSGIDTGRGTLSSPWRLCRDDWQSMAKRGDTIRLLAGVHPCEQVLYLRRGVSVEGDGAGLTMVGVAGRRFGSFSLWGGPHGKTRFSRLTFQDGGAFGAIQTFGGVANVVLQDVDFVGLSLPGLRMDFTAGRVALERVRYIDGHSSAIYATGDVHVDGRQVTVRTDYEGVTMDRGWLTLRDSSIQARRTAIEMGALNDSTLDPRYLVLEGCRLSALRGVLGYGADLAVSDSEIIGVGEPRGLAAIEFVGGTLTATRTRIHGFLSGIEHGIPSAGNTFANMDLDDVDVTDVGRGVGFGSYGSPSWLRVRRSTIAAASVALGISSPFVSVDLGTTATPGGNDLRASPTGQALIDGRSTVGPPIDAAGTTLNGHTYSGELRGPRSDADLAQSAANVVRF
jgi:hypothetical protein